MIVTFTVAAEADLEAIADWIAADDPLRATTFVIELRQNCEALSDMPRRFPLVPRYEDAGIRR
jgi:plasmid stabilization system protein ParE